MKIIKREIELNENIEIVPLADLHIGSKECDTKLLKETINYIKDNDNVYTIINGDILDNTTKNSVGNVCDNELQPMQQLLKAIEILEPIKDKILVIAKGNHESRTEKESDIDLIYLIAKQFNIIDRYASGHWYLYLYFGEKLRGRKAKMCYTITGYHGSGGGRAIGGKANRLVDMSNIAVADLYIMSHTHTPLSTKKSIYIPDYGNKSLICREMHYLMTNAFLKNGGYGEIAGFHPTTNTQCSAILNKSERRIKIII